MSKDDDEYRRQTLFCRTMAEQAASLESRAEWLRLARQWQSLADLKTAVDERFAPPRTKVCGAANS